MGEQGDGEQKIRYGEFADFLAGMFLRILADVTGHILAS